MLRLNGRKQSISVKAYERHMLNSVCLVSDSIYAPADYLFTTSWENLTEETQGKLGRLRS